MPVLADPIARVAGRPVMVVVAHGDDPALFVGGIIRLLADSGCEIHILRFTDDATDSDGLDADQTIARNRSEFERAAAIMGAAGTTSLNFPSDTLGDVPRATLREAVIRAIRTHRPYAVLTFDPYSVLYEDNQDHIKLAQEVDEAFWTSMFDKHHPDHALEGLAVHGVVERWYFGRRLLEPTDRIDVSTVLDAKVAAAQAHVTMMDNLLRQLVLMGRTAGIGDAILASRLSDRDALIEAMVRSRGVEELRIVRFAGFGDLLDDLVEEKG